MTTPEETCAEWNRTYLRAANVYSADPPHHRSSVYVEVRGAVTRTRGRAFVGPFGDPCILVHQILGAVPLSTVNVVPVAVVVMVLDDEGDEGDEGAGGML